MLIADQAETRAGGVVTPAVRDAIIDAAQKHPDKVFLVDSRKRAHLFRNMTLKPNLEEAQEASRTLIGTVDFAGLRRELGAKVLIVTHGSKGALVMEDGRETWAEARPVEQPGGYLRRRRQLCGGLCPVRGGPWRSGGGRPLWQSGRLHYDYEKGDRNRVT